MQISVPLSIDYWLSISQIVGGFSAAIGVIFALVAIPRAFWQASENRQSLAASLFHDKQRLAFSSGLAVMDAIERRHDSIVSVDPDNPKDDEKILNIIAVEVAFDRFRSDLTTMLSAFDRARAHVELEELLGIYRLIGHLWVLADIYANTTSDEIEKRLDRRIYRGTFDGFSYKCYAIVKYINDDIKTHPTMKRLLKKFPNAWHDVEDEVRDEEPST